MLHKLIVIPWINNLTLSRVICYSGVRVRHETTAERSFLTPDELGKVSSLTVDDVPATGVVATQKLIEQFTTHDSW